MERYIDRYPPSEDALRDRNDPRSPVRYGPRRLPVDGEIDLHGYTAEEAETELSQFIARAVVAGWRKILVIHGKGLHAGSSGTLKAVVQRVLAADTRIGATGSPPARQGGTGATWAVVKQSYS
jgi:DNA-nicking Smr family endonuclease